MDTTVTKERNLVKRLLLAIFGIVAGSMTGWAYILLILSAALNHFYFHYLLEEEGEESGLLLKVILNVSPFKTEEENLGFKVMVVIHAMAMTYGLFYVLATLIQ